MKYRVPMTTPSFGDEEIEEAVDSLKSKKVTMDEKVKIFEHRWRDYVGTKFALAVNSGSSANLLAHNILADPSIVKNVKPGDEVITPALTWGTTVFPIVQIGAIPVFVDVVLDTFNIDTKQLERACSDRTAAISFVDLQGNPCEMRELTSFAKEHNLLMIEDACEAAGAEYEGKKCGTFGDIGTFSFYNTHVISTMEGGMLAMDKEEYYEIGRAMRNHGLIAGLRTEKRIAAQHRYPNERLIFEYLGYNFKPLEIQGAFGIHQITKLDEFVRVRRLNAEYWIEELSRYGEYFILPKTTKNGKHSWHHFLIVIKPNAPFTRDQFVNFLEKEGVEARSLSDVNICEHPAMSNIRSKKIGDLKNASLIAHNSVEWGNHHGITENDRAFVVECVKEFIKTNAS